MIERFEKFTGAVFDITRYWHKIASEEMEKYGLKGSYAIYLTTLYRSPEGISAMDLCRLCGKDKADVSRMVNIMAEKELVIKEGNFYRARIKLTHTGKMAAEQVSKRAALAVEIAGSGVSEEDREIFYNVLLSIASNLQNLSEDGLPEE